MDADTFLHKVSMIVTGDYGFDRNRSVIPPDWANLSPVLLGKTFRREVRREGHQALRWIGYGLCEYPILKNSCLDCFIRIYRNMGGVNEDAILDLRHHRTARIGNGGGKRRKGEVSVFTDLPFRLIVNHILSYHIVIYAESVPKYLNRPDIAEYNGGTMISVLNKEISEERITAECEHVWRTWKKLRRSVGEARFVKLIQIEKFIESLHEILPFYRGSDMVVMVGTIRMGLSDRVVEQLLPKPDDGYKFTRHDFLLEHGKEREELKKQYGIRQVAIKVRKAEVNGAKDKWAAIVNETLQMILLELQKKRLSGEGGKQRDLLERITRKFHVSTYGEDEEESIDELLEEYYGTESVFKYIVDDKEFLNLLLSVMSTEQRDVYVEIARVEKEQTVLVKKRTKIWAESVRLNINLLLTEWLELRNSAAGGEVQMARMEFRVNKILEVLNISPNTSNLNKEEYLNRRFGHNMKTYHDRSKFSSGDDHFYHISNTDRLYLIRTLHDGRDDNREDNMSIVIGKYNRYLSFYFSCFGYFGRDPMRTIWYLFPNLSEYTHSEGEYPRYADKIVHHPVFSITSIAHFNGSIDNPMWICMAKFLKTPKLTEIDMSGNFEVYKYYHQWRNPTEWQTKNPYPQNPFEYKEWLTRLKHLSLRHRFGGNDNSYNLFDILSPKDFPKSLESLTLRMFQDKKSWVEIVGGNATKRTEVKFIPIRQLPNLKAIDFSHVYGKPLRFEENNLSLQRMRFRHSLDSLRYSSLNTLSFHGLKRLEFLFCHPEEVLSHLDCPLLEEIVLHASVIPQLFSIFFPKLRSVKITHQEYGNVSSLGSQLAETTQLLPFEQLEELVIKRVGISEVDYQSWIAFFRNGNEWVRMPVLKRFEIILYEPARWVERSGSDEPARMDPDLEEREGILALFREHIGPVLRENTVQFVESVNGRQKYDRDY